MKIPKFFRGDAAFASPKLFRLLEAESYWYVIRLKANAVLERQIAYLLKRPEFYRILYESELFSPEAFQQHVDVIARGYQRVLKRAADAGDARAVDPREYEVLAFMLMGARKYLSSRFARSNGSIRELPDFVTKAYMRFVCNGFWDEHASIANSPPAKQTKKPALVTDRSLRGEKA